MADALLMPGITFDGCWGKLFPCAAVFSEWFLVGTGSWLLLATVSLLILRESSARETRIMPDALNRLYDFVDVIASRASMNL